MQWRAAQLESAQLEPVPAPEGGPPAAFVQAVELGLRAAEAEARRRLEKLIQQAQEGVAADVKGNVYGSLTGGMALKKYVKNKS